MSAYVDREGDLWRGTGRGVGPDAVLVCVESQNPEEGDGGEPDWPWTLSLVIEYFGPLTPLADVLPMRQQVDREDGFENWRRSA